MLGGGRAILALVGSDDPRLAGLEIYLQLLGKRLCSLALLSEAGAGNNSAEPDFRRVRCNPVPVYVLDEVDALRDDANVDGFAPCSPTWSPKPGPGHWW